MYNALVDGFPILASRGLDPRQKYVCPQCSERVALKTGLYVAPHFAHYPRSDCPRRGGGEGKEHAFLKVQFHDLLLPRVARGTIHDLKIEARFGEMVCDLGFATRQGRNVAVEITVNNLDFAHAQEKIKAYRGMGIYPLWLFADSVLRAKAEQALAPEKIIAAMHAETPDWVELDGLYRPSRVMIYLHSFLGCAFLLLPDGLPAVIRLVKTELWPPKRGPRYEVQVLPKACYPLRLELVIYRYDGPRFPTPARTLMAALVPQLGDFGPRLFYGIDRGNVRPRRALVSERTGIRFNFPVLENGNRQSIYNS